MLFILWLHVYYNKSVMSMKHHKEITIVSKLKGIHYTIARWLLWLITQIKSLPCNQSAIIEVPTSVIALWLSYLQCGELHVLALQFQCTLAASNCYIACQNSYYYKNTAGTFRMYMYCTEQSSALSRLYRSSVPYYCHWRSHLVQILHYSTQPFLSKLILLFSLGFTVGPVVHSKDHCYMYFLMSVQSVTPAPRALVKRSLDDDINEAQSQQPLSNHI